MWQKREKPQKQKKQNKTKQNKTKKKILLGVNWMNNLLCLGNIAFLKSQPRKNPKDNFRKLGLPNVIGKQYTSKAPALSGLFTIK